MGLQEEISAKSKEIFAESYSMSIGEIISMYKEEELDIHPEFQRFFRWSATQKTRLIESFLLNIPVPSIFVSQREDGVWDVIDGLQRLSTIFQFVGIYKDHNGELLTPLILEETKMLPSLKGKKFNGDDDNSFSDIERRFFKRAKLEIIIIKKESDRSGKYELFQRLNTGGTSLSDQEVRNCLMVMSNPSMFERIQALSSYDNFKDSLRIGDKAFDERYDLELITRFICLRKENPENIKTIADFGDYLDNRIIELLEDAAYDWDEEFSIFKRTFDFINEKIGDEGFCKYFPSKTKFSGQFLVSAFEIVAIGLGRKDGTVSEPFDLRTKLIELWNRINDESISWSGSNAAGRLARTLKLGEELYGN